MLRHHLLIALCLFSTAPWSHAAEIAITMDDPNLEETPLFKAEERNRRILSALKESDLQAALFVCGMRVDSARGTALVQSWNDDGHLIANHSYSHHYYPSQKISFEEFSKDFSRGETIIRGFAHFTKFFRFPYLKEGDSIEKRDGMRTLLKEQGYRNGYVTVDASDWYVDQRMRARLRQNSKTDLSGYRAYYLNHMWDRATYYNELSKKVLGREARHTLLIHHNLLNALFLKDLLAMFRAKGWKPIAASTAFADPIYNELPNILPAGESLIWALAKETGKYEAELRYPGEDGEYEKAAMDRLGL